MWNQTVSLLEQEVIDTLWAQWDAVGGAASARRRARSIIDPEALVLASLSFRDRERRLWDLASWAALEATTLLSVQRIKNLAADYPESTARALGEFSTIAFGKGRDHRWRKLAGPKPAFEPRASKLGTGAPRLIEDSTVLMRLRLGISVGIKADLVALLLGHKGALIVKDMAAATGYAPAAVRRAADDLSRARLVRRIEGHPAEYRVDAAAWKRLLELKEAPPWSYLHQTFAFSAQLSALRNRLVRSEASPYVASSELRRVMGAHSRAFQWHGLLAPETERYPGEAFLDELERAVSSLAAWVRDNV